MQVPEYLVAGARQFGFMLRGLKLMQPKLEALNIPFFLVKGDPIKTIPDLCKKLKAGCLVTDFASLRLGREWRDEVHLGLPHRSHLMSMLRPFSWTLTGAISPEPFATEDSHTPDQGCYGVGKNGIVLRGYLVTHVSACPALCLGNRRSTLR